MKAKILSSLLASLYLNASAQQFEIETKFDSVSVAYRNPQTGSFDYKPAQGAEISVFITDSTIVVKTEHQEEKRYRVFPNQGTVYEQTENNTNGGVFYSVIDDKAGTFFEAQYVIAEFDSIILSLGNDTKRIIYWQRRTKPTKN